MPGLSSEINVKGIVSMTVGGTAKDREWIEDAEFSVVRNRPCLERYGFIGLGVSWYGEVMDGWQSALLNSRRSRSR